MSALANALAGSTDLFVPAFEVWIGTNKIDRSIIRDVLDVSFHDSLDEIGGFSLTLANLDTEDRQFSYSDSHIFDPGRRLDLRMGYLGRGQMNWMVRGVITELTPSFPASGTPTLQVSGRNRLHDLLGRKQSLSEQKDVDLAGRIGRAMSDVRVIADPMTVATDLIIDELIQDNEFDLVFLKRRARQLGYELIISEDEDRTVLRLVNSALRQDEPLHLAYRGARGSGPLIEFQPRFSTTRQPSSLQLNSWNPKDKAAISVHVTRSDVRIKDPEFDRSAIADAVRERTEVVSAEPVQDEAEARRRAKEYLERIVKETMTATGRTIGLPDLRAGTVLKVAGVGKRFDGRWLVTGSDHSIGSGGYTTTFACRREEI
jgi:phage protein D